MGVARRLAGLIVALVLAASLPLAAARAACVCDHGHGGVAAPEPQKPHEPHQCTSACTAATCPMHRAAQAAAPAGKHSAHARHDAPSDASRGRDAVSCNCAGEARALIAQVTPAAVLPATVTLGAPIFAAPSRTSVAEATLRLSATPPAPPPRA
jgi:hypothetical protein